MARKIEFTRGDAAYHTLSMPTASWIPGGILFFAAKPFIDDDNTDVNAVIQANWSDADTTDVIINSVAYKNIIAISPPSATNSILSDGADSIDYLGEFQFVPPDGIPVTIPPDNKKLSCIVYFDVKRKIIP